MSVWLTPELKPFFGGTYFPPSRAHGRPAFLEVVQAIARMWRVDRPRLLQQAESVMGALRDHAANSSSANPETGAPVAGEILAALEQFEAMFDAQHGGFGGAPKFPRPAALTCVSRALTRVATGSEEHRAGVRILGMTLLAMARGGIHDHVGGGFHRYTVDERWHVPHFEKMLYDQGQLAVAYADAAQQLRMPALHAPLRALLEYVSRDLTHPEGGCFSAEDADSLRAEGSSGESGKGEGAFYVWTDAELREVLGAELHPLVAYAYGVIEHGNVPSEHDPHGEFTGVSILERRATPDQIAQRFGRSEPEVEVELVRARSLLQARRVRRPRPHLDDKVVSAWNGMMISGYSRAAQVLGESSYADTAARIAAFLRRELYDTDRRILHRTWRAGRSPQPGFAEDYALVAQGLLDLYETSFDWHHLEWALELQERMVEMFYDQPGGGFFSSPEDAPDLVLRLKEDYDGAEPAPSSAAALNLARLAAMLKRDDLRRLSLATLRAFSARWRGEPTAMPAMAVAADFVAGPVKQVIVSGDPSLPDTYQLIRTAHGVFCPRRVLLQDDRGEGRAWLARKVPYIAALPQDGPSTAHVCEDFACQLPTTSPVKLRELMLGRSSQDGAKRAALE
jgi:hypothetical protein